MSGRHGFPESTCAALATAPGAAVRAVVRLSGRDGRQIASRRFLPARGERPLEQVRRGVVRGRWRAVGLTAPVPVFLWLQRAPRSFTGEDVVEIHFPGAPVLARLLLDDLVAAGVRLAEPGEFTRRAFENGRIDLTRAEATLLLIRAEGEEERRGALSMLLGGLAGEVRELADRILQILVPLELGLDFSDQDVEIPLPAGGVDRLGEAVVRMRELAARSATCGRLDGCVRVMLAGPPNAGKSSLFNRLAGREAAIVSAVPGTTRDVLEARIRVAGETVVLWDTAGEGFDGGQADLQAHRMRERFRGEADVVLAVDPATERPAALRPSGPKALIPVATFGDRLPRPWPEIPVVVDNVSGAGIDRLVEVLAETLGALRRPAAGTPVSVRQGEHLLAAAVHGERGLLAMDEGRAAELVAADLRLCLDELLRVTGELATEAVLSRIFSSFCIGK